MTGPLTAGDPLAPPARPPSPGRVPGGGPTPPRRPRFRWLRRLVGLVLGLTMLAAAAVGVVGWHFYEGVSRDLPTLDNLHHYQPRVMSRIYAEDDRLIAELASERRIFVPLSAMPDLVRNAFVSAEDQKFWTHRGVDPAAMLRAAWTDVQLKWSGQNRRPIGASTITQQVARNMLLGSNELSYTRKLKEALLAIRIEEVLSKERILELYLNEIYLGLGSYGVASAAQAYFNKGLDDLTPAEAAFLAGLPKGPSDLNPFRYPDRARERRDYVLARMEADGVISRDQARAAREEAINPTPFHRAEVAPGADWFSEDVRRQLVDRFGNDALTSGLTVQTSLNPRLQTEADHALRAGLAEYDRKHGGWRGPVTHLDAGPAFHANWVTSLAGVKRPPGMLPDWQLAVVLEGSGSEATIGWLDLVPGHPIANAVPRTGTLAMSDTGWARAARGGGGLGPVPRRLADVVKTGDVVMVQLAGNGPGMVPGDGRNGARFLLRQVPAVQGAMVAVEPATGRVLAMAGGWSHEASVFNRATQAQRQPGSSFKPMVYLTAMEHGIPPSQRFLDEPFSLGDWHPNNYEMSFSGPTPLHVALEKSLNLVTVRLADKLGMGEVAKTAIAFHVVDQMPKVLPAALGAVDTTVMRMAGAYASLAMNGREVIPTLIDSIQDRDGHVIYRSPGLTCLGCDVPGTPPKLSDGRAQIADPASVFQVVTMMQGVVNRGTGIEAGRGLGRAIAGKTGTSQDFNDAWFVGFTPDLVAAVWIGFDQPASLGKDETGGAVSAPIWHDFMAAALKDRPNLVFRIPEGVTMARWSSSAGPTIDAFKPGQQPGSSDGTLSAEAGQSNGDGEAGGGGGGLDSGMGGLY